VSPFDKAPVAGADTGSDSLQAAGNVVAPVAAGVVANLAAPPAGIYEVRVAASVGAGAVAADNGNVKLQRGGVDLLAVVPTNGAEQLLDRVTVTGAQALTLVAIGNATAAVVYSGRISVTKIA
jgi:hypothetical protein